MPKVIGLTDYILLGAALAADLIGEVRSGAGIYRSALKTRYGYVPKGYKKTSYFTTVSRLLKTGEIKRKVKENGETYLELTSRGEKKIKRKYPLAFKNRKWDGKFMIVVFDIPEERRSERDALRQKLIDLGFGMLQKSVWISPYHFEEDMREFLVNNGLSEDVFVLKARQLWAGNVKKIAERIWDLKKLNGLYEKIVERGKKMKTISKEKKKGKEKGKLLKQYLEALSKDPMLPAELLPNYWSRGKALEHVR